MAAITKTECYAVLRSFASRLKERREHAASDLDGII